MPNHAIWNCIQAVSSALGTANEETLDVFVSDLRMMGPTQRDQLRQDFRDVIAGLTLLELRLGSEGL